MPPFIRATRPAQAAPAKSTTLLFFRRRIAGVTLGIALAAALPAGAQTCESPPTQAHLVQGNFQRVAKEGDFVTARDYAERTWRGLDQLAAQARRCGCAAAQSGFEAAASEMRLTKGTDTRKDLRAVADKAFALFEGAMAEQRKCAGF
ncbi:MAG: hypothetical protein WCF44_15980 [Candidatus Methylophosphatis roskildensis]